MKTTTCPDCLVADKQYACKTCDYNIGCKGIAGPCGQQNCWYSCVVCKNNHGCYHGSDEDEN